jgi:hypothetical protein
MVSWSWEDMAFQIAVNTASGTVSGIVIAIVLKFINDYISNKKIWTRVLVQHPGSWSMVQGPGPKLYNFQVHL